MLADRERARLDGADDLVLPGAPSHGRLALAVVRDSGGPADVTANGRVFSLIDDGGATEPDRSRIPLLFSVIKRLVLVLRAVRTLQVRLIAVRLPLPADAWALLIVDELGTGGDIGQGSLAHRPDHVLNIARDLRGILLQGGPWPAAGSRALQGAAVGGPATFPLRGVPLHEGAAASLDR